MSAIGSGSLGAPYSVSSGQPGLGQGQPSSATTIQDTADTFTPSSKKAQQPQS